jgi:hypothetical protein
MLEELQRTNYSQATISSYINAVKDFAEYFRKSPDLLGAEEVRRYHDFPTVYPLSWIHMPKMLYFSRLPRLVFSISIAMDYQTSIE